MTTNRTDRLDLRWWWAAVHAVVAALFPWVAPVIAWFGDGPASLAESATFFEHLYWWMAVGAGVLLVSSLALRWRGPSAGATIGFSILWALAIAVCLSGARYYSPGGQCRTEAWHGEDAGGGMDGPFFGCLPGFELFSAYRSTWQ